MNITGLKIPTGGRQTSWLFTSMTEELNWGLPRNNSSLVLRAGLEPATSGFQVRRPNHSATLPPRLVNAEKTRKENLFILRATISSKLTLKKISAPDWLIASTIMQFGTCPTSSGKVERMFRPNPAGEESYELLRDWTYNLPTPPRTLPSYCCNIIVWYVLFVKNKTCDRKSVN